MSAPQLAPLQPMSAAVPIATASGPAPAEASPFARLLDAQLAQLSEAARAAGTPADALLAALEGESAKGRDDALAALLASWAAMKVSPMETASSEPAEGPSAPSDALAALMASLMATMKGDPAVPAPKNSLNSEDRTAASPAALVDPIVLPALPSMANDANGHPNAAPVAAPNSTLATQALASQGLTGTHLAAALVGREQEALIGQGTAQTAAVVPPAAASTAAGPEFSAVLSHITHGTRSGAPEAAVPSSVANAEASSPSTAAPPPPMPVRHEVHTADARLTQPVGTPAWSNELGQKVLLMAQRQEGRAELVLTPPHMGRIEISLQVNHDQANALFTSANPAVREALEAALPRLREVLLEAGIQLGQAQVGADPRSSQQQPGENRDNRPTGELTFGEQSLAARPLAAESSMTLRRGLVDTFA